MALCENRAMETKLCRICGKLGENYVHIFKTEGLKNKIETCLPIIVSVLCCVCDRERRCVFFQLTHPYQPARPFKLLFTLFLFVCVCVKDSVFERLFAVGSTVF